MGGVGYFVTMTVVILNKELCFKNLSNSTIRELWEAGYLREKVIGYNTEH